MIDIERVRLDTAGCEAVVHLNNAGSSLPPRQVVDAQVAYLRAEETDGGYEVAAARAEDLDRVYAATARYLGCQPREVAFVASAGEAWWRAFMAVDPQPGERILVSRSEYQANAFGWLQARDRGVQVDVVPNTDSGEVDLAALESMLDETVRLVSFTMVAMTNGCIQPAAAVGELLADSNALYLLDACQAAGQMPLDVAELGCDFMAYTGRKFMRGPRGTGILFASDSAVDQLGPSPFVDGRSAVWASADTWHHVPHAQRFELGEFGYGAKVGLGVATEYMLEIGPSVIRQRVDQLATSLRAQLAEIGPVVVRDQGAERCGIVTFTVDGHNAGALQLELQRRGINLSAPMAANAQLEIGVRDIDQVLRAGVHYFNTEAELDQLCAELGQLTA